MIRNVNTKFAAKCPWEICLYPSENFVQFVGISRDGDAIRTVLAGNGDSFHEMRDYLFMAKADSSHGTSLKHAAFC